MDQFSDIVNSGSHLDTSWSRFHGGTENMHPADRFLTISKKLYIGRLRLAEKYNRDKVLIFSFEDFLQKHSTITFKLKLFLNITSERSFQNKRFILKNSIKNIGNGKNNEKMKELLYGKDYVMEELNEYRNKLKNHKYAI
jgi:hypothetical protein